MTYIDYLKDEITHRYFGFLFGAVLFGIMQYLLNASLLIAFLQSCVFFISLLMANSYMKYRRRK